MAVNSELAFLESTLHNPLLSRDSYGVFYRGSTSEPLMDGFGNPSPRIQSLYTRGACGERTPWLGPAPRRTVPPPQPTGSASSEGPRKGEPGWERSPRQRPGHVEESGESIS